MQTWARYSLIVSLAAVLLAGPVLAVPTLPRSCSMPAAVDGTMSCGTSAHACCAACSGGEKSCCQHTPTSPQVSDHEAGCGSCPLGQCGCCQSAQGAAIVCVLPQRSPTATPVLSGSLLTTDSVLFSRSDEPLLPPPIA